MIKVLASQVDSFIPHREPFSFVKSAEIVGIDEIEGTCAWSSDNPLFAGHFPELPLVPGVLMVEAAAQLVGILISHKGRESQARGNLMSRLGVLIGIKKSSFHKPVRPGEEIFYKMQLDNVAVGMAVAHGGAVNAAGDKVCKCEISVAIIDPETLSKAG